MHKGGTAVGFISAVALGIGSMVGAGIFALLGEAGAIASSAVYLSFVIGGLIAMLSAYSLGRLGATYPTAGGIVEYLGQSFGVGIFSGGMSIVMYIAAVVSLSLVAKAFGSYALTFLPDSMIVKWGGLWSRFFALAVVVFFVVLNLNGVRSMALVENLIVGIKLAVLGIFAIVGLFFIDASRLAPDTYPPVSDIWYSLAITFFAYEGFRVITNAAEDMPNPQRTLPRAMMTAVLVVMVLYVLVAVAVFGNLPAEQVIAAKDYALAAAAQPVFGSIGFTLTAVAALIATASALNAALYAVTNVTYQLARNGQLPRAFGKPIRHSREGLVISGAFIALLALLLDLSEIAVLGSISILLVHASVHAGHLRLLGKTGASPVLVILALVSNVAAAGLSIYHQSRVSPLVIVLLILFLGGSFVLEVLLRRFAGKEFKLRMPDWPWVPIKRRH